MADKKSLKKLDRVLKNLVRGKDDIEKEESSEKESVNLALFLTGLEDVRELKENIVDSNSKMIDALSNFKVEVPDVVIPEIKIPEIKVPEIKIPQIKVPQPKVTVNVPEVKLPKIVVPPVEMPDSMNISGDVGLRDVDRDNPVPVLMVDAKGNPAAMGGGSVSGGARTVKVSGITEVEERIRTVSYQIFEDTSFVAGDSPVTLDCNDALGRNATEFSIQNDGPGNFTVAVSEDGSAFGDEKTIFDGEVFAIDRISIDSIRITHVADSAYRVTVL